MARADSYACWSKVAPPNGLAASPNPGPIAALYPWNCACVVAASPGSPWREASAVGVAPLDMMSACPAVGSCPIVAFHCASSSGRAKPTYSPVNGLMALPVTPRY